MKPGQDYVGVYVGTFVHDGKGQYLLGYRTKNCRDEQDCWDMTFKVELGETLEEAVRREIKEEIGAEVLTLTYLGYKETFREHDGKRHIGLVFIIKFLGSIESKNVEPDMCSELRWCTLNSIPKPRHSHMDSNLEKYKDKL
ncbi:MAG: NUDIX domain-containing protein [Candidatus Paceibacterota bacterium]